MKRTWDPTIPAVVAAIVMLVGTVAATGGIPPGHWRAESGSDPRSVRLDIRMAEGNRQSRISTDVPTAELVGFDAAAFSRSGAPLRLAWKHDAGTIVLEGEGGRRPGGKVHFEPDATFTERWRALGFETPGEIDLLLLAVQDIRLADAERLHEMGYTSIDVDAFIRFESEHDAMKQLEEMHALGLRLEFDDLFRLRSHGVSMADVRAYQAAGLRLDPDSLIRLRNHGIEASYAKGMIDAGVAKDDLDAILRLHAHGVPTDYVARVRATGFSDADDVDDLIRLHDQGVDSDYVRGLVQSNLTRMSLDDVVRLHAHGVPTDYVREIVAVDAGRSADDVIRLRDHGVSADLVRSLAQAGHRDLSVDDAIRAATRGPESLGAPGGAR